jgi:uncharacterized protein (TIGR02145 family)
MKNKLLLSSFIILGMIASGQRPALDLTYTAIDNAVHVQMDSIKVMNLTQGGDTVIYWPDTILSLYYVGIQYPKQQESGFRILKNYPNPVLEQTTILLFIPEKDKVSLIITDMVGRMIFRSEQILEKGIHSFRFTPGGANLYYFTTQWRGMSCCIKILKAFCTSNGVGSLEYIGCEASSPKLKSTEDVQSFSFSIGDTLLYIGYANSHQSGITKAPESSQTYTFQFATNIPCPGTPIVEYEGQVYNTIQIFSQCWLKENLNAGTFIPQNQQMSDNGILEKYCYNNEEDSCFKYGGLYQWKEMMQYTTQQCVQGICPPGFHIPADEEWKILEGAADLYYGIGDPEWDNSGLRGYNTGTNLKTTYGWYEPEGNGNGTDLYGFSCLPGGGLMSGSVFANIVMYGYWWTSTENSLNYAYSRNLIYGLPRANRVNDYKGSGYSVRCLRDD